MNNTVVCDHCLLEVKKNAAIADMDHGKEVFFCCHGCRSVYFILKSEGFESFYDRREESWEPGPVDSAYISEDLFTDFITETEEGTEVDVLLSGIRCASCVWLVENFMKKEPGVQYIRVNYATHRAKIKWDDSKTTLRQILDKISSIGYAPMPPGDTVQTIFEKERTDYFYRFSVGAFFTMQLMLYSVALYAGYFQGMSESLKDFLQYIAWALATPVMFYSGWPFIKNSVKAFKNKTFNMDTLVFLGSFSAYTYSIAAVFTSNEVYFDTSATIITLILLGRYIENGALVRTSNAVTRLLSFQPQQVRLVRNPDNKSFSETDLEVETVHIKEVKPGDFMEVLPGQSVPADGVVVYGRSDADESMLTGESVPQLKEDGAEVFAGTQNINGRLVIKALKTGGDTALSKIVTAVQDAQSEKAPIQNVADRVVNWFVPSIIAIAVSTFAYWLLNGAYLFESVMNAVSVLVIACPCALGLATPLAILVSTSKIAGAGAVVKSGDVIERMSGVDNICFDKTGTVTKGELEVSHYEAFSGDADEMLRYAASAERGSSHLISKAVLSSCDEKLYGFDYFSEKAGYGIQAVVNGKIVRVGNVRFLESENIQITDEQQSRFAQFADEGRITVLVSIEDSAAGLIAMSDTLRSEAYGALETLGMGAQISVLTGDNALSASRIADSLPDNIVWKAELTPFAKTEYVRELQAEGKKVCMIGDGINDAPALTQADVGISMGRGTDIAIESSDAVLMREDLTIINTVYSSCRQTLRIIKQNLFWAFSYNLVAVPLAVSGQIHPIVSAALMSLSSLIVVFNSLRINAKSSERP